MSGAEPVSSERGKWGVNNYQFDAVGQEYPVQFGAYTSAQYGGQFEHGGENHTGDMVYDYSESYNSASGPYDPMGKHRMNFHTVAKRPFTNNEWVTKDSAVANSAQAAAQAAAAAAANRQFKEGGEYYLTPQEIADIEAGGSIIEYLDKNTKQINEKS